MAPIAADANVQVAVLSRMCANNVFGTNRNSYLVTQLNLPNVYAAPLVANTNYCIKIAPAVTVYYPGFSSTLYTSTAAFGNGLLVPTIVRGTRVLGTDGVSGSSSFGIGAYFA